MSARKVICGSIALIALLALSSCQEQVVVPPGIRPAQVWEVQPHLAARTESYSGEIKPRQVVDLSFRVAGKLLGRHVEVGDTVSAGQELARLDDEDSRISVSQSESGLQSTQMSLQAARDNHAASQGALLSVQNNLTAAQGALTSARANLAAMRAALETAQSAVDSAKATAASAQATVGVAEAEMRNAQLEYQRTVKLVQQGFAGKAVQDRDSQRLATAQANLKAAQANAAAAQAQVQASLSRVKTSQAQVQAAQGEVDSASANIGALGGQVKTAQAQAQAAAAQIGVAQAQITNTEAQLRLVKNQSSYTVLKSTVTGVVTRTLAEVGQVLAAGQPVLSVARANEYEVHIRVGEQAIKSLKPGLSARVALWTDPEHSLAGTVRELAPLADENRTWLVKVAINPAEPEDKSSPPAASTAATPDQAAPAPSAQPAADEVLTLAPKRELRLGMTAKVSFATPLPQAVVWLPATALFQQDKRPAVWVLDANNQVNLQGIQVEQYLDDGLLVAGLTPGSKVIAAGVNRLYAGQAVQPVPYDGQAQAVVQ